MKRLVDWAWEIGGGLFGVSIGFLFLVGCESFGKGVSQGASGNLTGLGPGSSAGDFIAYTLGTAIGMSAAHAARGGLRALMDKFGGKNGPEGPASPPP